VTARDFVYWLQGKLELDAAVTDGEGFKPLSAAQVIVIARHLALVFAHEIDPQAGDAAKQQVLGEIHGGKKWMQLPDDMASAVFSVPPNPNVTMRC
jgi:hypothetical protein